MQHVSMTITLRTFQVSTRPDHIEQLQLILISKENGVYTRKMALLLTMAAYTRIYTGQVVDNGGLYCLQDFV